MGEYCEYPLQLSSPYIRENVPYLAYYYGLQYSRNMIIDQQNSKWNLIQYNDVRIGTITTI